MMPKSMVSLSIDKDVAKSVEYNMQKLNEIRAKKMKKPISKSAFYQDLIVIGLIIKTNKHEDIPKILEMYFEDESK